jgi:hypothetical protein
MTARLFVIRVSMPTRSGGTPSFAVRAAEQPWPQTFSSGNEAVGYLVAQTAAVQPAVAPAASQPVSEQPANASTTAKATA